MSAGTLTRGANQIPVFEPEAKRLLTRIENVAHHYKVRAPVQ
jgi:hypothetical protein